MAIQSGSTHLESRPRYWLRVLRPLLWWLLLVLVLFGIRTHQRLMERTRLIFTVSVNGRTDYFSAAATLDGKRVSDGSHVSLGNHHFEITHPKGVAYSTNLFIWYGGHNFGNVDLPRAKGNLGVRADLPASRLVIRGPEFETTLTNSTGFSASVPTDEYVVEAQYRHWQTRQATTVYENIAGNVVIVPMLGTLQLSCNQSDATFQLVRGEDDVVESGVFPSTIIELPTGSYNLIAWHHKRRWDVRPSVMNRATNNVLVEFKYGSAVVETKPSGASVSGSDGHYWGTTPLQLSELQPGMWKFNLRLDNFETVSALVDIVADTTNTFRTNLISQSFTGAMRAARQSMDIANYDSAIEYVSDALRANPDDPAATSLLREANGLRSIRLAETFEKNGDFIAGGLELQKALAFLPDNQRAKQMLAQFKQHEPEQRERMRVERLGRGIRVFNDILKRYSDADLFDGFEFQSTKPLNEVHEAIIDAMRGQTGLRYTSDKSPLQETFEIQASQEFQTVLATSAGRRNVIIVGAQVKNEETQVLYKVLEYKTEAQIKFSIGNLIGAPAAVNYVPLHLSRIPNMSEKNKAQVAEGVSNITARIQFALGQTNPPTVVK